MVRNLIFSDFWCNFIWSCIFVVFFFFFCSINREYAWRVYGKKWRKEKNVITKNYPKLRYSLIRESTRNFVFFVVFFFLWFRSSAQFSANCVLIRMTNSTLQRYVHEFNWTWPYCNAVQMWWVLYDLNADFFSLKRSRVLRVRCVTVYRHSWTISTLRSDTNAWRTMLTSQRNTLVGLGFWGYADGGGAGHAGTANIGAKLHRVFRGYVDISGIMTIADSEQLCPNQRLFGVVTAKEQNET